MMGEESRMVSCVPSEAARFLRPPTSGTVVEDIPLRSATRVSSSDRRIPPLRSLYAADPAICVASPASGSYLPEQLTRAEDPSMYELRRALPLIRS